MRGPDTITEIVLGSCGADAYLRPFGADCPGRVSWTTRSCYASWVSAHLFRWWGSHYSLMWSTPSLLFSGVKFAKRWMCKQIVFVSVFDGVHLPCKIRKKTRDLLKLYCKDRKFVFKYFLFANIVHLNVKYETFVIWVSVCLSVYLCVC